MHCVLGDHKNVTSFIQAGVLREGVCLGKGRDRPRVEIGEMCWQEALRLPHPGGPSGKPQLLQIRPLLL